MEEKMTVRLSSKDKQRLVDLATESATKSLSDMARKCLLKGLQSLELTATEKLILTNTIQSIYLAREAINMLCGSPEESEKIMANARAKALESSLEAQKHIGAMP